MPLRKTRSGWMWGGQGPFPTKAKALQVARAAYASGYREAAFQPTQPTPSAATSVARTNDPSSIVSAPTTAAKTP